VYEIAAVSKRAIAFSYKTPAIFSFVSVVSLMILFQFLKPMGELASLFIWTIPLFHELSA
jgi:hypothetical protein